MLGVLALALSCLLDLGTAPANRIVPGTGGGRLAAVGWTGAGLVTGILLATIVLSTLPLRRRYELLLGLIGLSLATMPLLLDMFAALHLPEGSPYARSSVGAGFWSLLFLLSLMLIETLGRLEARRWLQLILLVFIGGSWIVLLRGEGLESLSLVREFNARPDKIQQAR